MKKLTIILTLLLITSVSTWATRYYFSSKDGSDAYTGLSSSQAWLTRSKLQSLLSSLNPGDTVSFDRSCTWDEFYLVIDNIDGTYGNEIVFNTYGNGRRPVFKGTTDYSGTMSVSSDLYSISGDADIGDMDWPNVFRQIWIDSVYHAPSRFPNSGFLDAESGGVTSLTDTDASWSTNDHADGVMVGYLTAWEWTQGLIASNTSTALTFSNTLSYEDGGHTVTPGSGDYYFIQGSPSTTATDLDGENYFEDDGFTILWTADNLNSSHKVECTTVDTMFHMTDCSYIKFEDLIMEKVNQYIFVLEDCNNITLDGNGLNWSQGGFIRGDDVDTLTIHNNFFHEAQNSPMHLDYCGMVSCRYNDFKNITVRDGLRNLNTRYNSIMVVAYSTDSIVFQYNDMDTIAGIGNQHWSENTGIDYAVLYDKNVATHYGWVKLGDNGAFYNGGEWDSDIRKIYSNNLLINAGYNIEYNYGTSPQEHFHAFYNDYNSSGSSYLNNTVFNANMFCFINGGDPGSGTSLLWENNLTFNGTQYMGDQWANLFNFVNAGSNNYPRNDTIINNTFVFGNNEYERAYAFSDFGTTITGMDFDNNSFLDPFTNDDEDIYREINSTSVTANYNISELCGNRSMDCSSTFENLLWDYGSIDGVWSEDDFAQAVWNGTDTTWYWQLGEMTVKDVKTGTNYSDSVAIPPYSGNVYFLVSGDDAGSINTLGDTSRWYGPLTWYEELNDTAFASTESECLYYVSVRDTTIVVDSLGCSFENSLTVTYGDYDINSTGTLTYSGLGVCDGSYTIYPDNQCTIYTDNINLGSSFNTSLCYTFYGSNTGTILANRSSGSGWELNRGDGECLEFVTSDGVNTDTIQSAAAAIGTNGQNYEIEIRVDVSGGTMSMIVDDVYITPADSSIQTDFGVGGPIYIGMDAGGNDEVWANLDSWHIDWSDITIIAYDSCVTSGTFQDTISAFDTTAFKDFNYEYGTNSTFYYSSCDDTLSFIDDEGYFLFYNVDFGSGANAIEIRYHDQIPEGVTFGYVTTSLGGAAVGTFITEASSLCTSIDISLDERITGVTDLYFYGSLGTVSSAAWFDWFRFYDTVNPSRTQWRLEGKYKINTDSVGRWVINR